MWCTGVLYHNPEQLRFVRQLFDLTAPGGHLVLEVGDGQALAVATTLAVIGYLDVVTTSDLTSRDRVVEGRRD